jgi:hypothetical protein
MLRRIEQRVLFLKRRTKPGEMLGLAQDHQHLSRQLAHDHQHPFWRGRTRGRSLSSMYYLSLVHHVRAHSLRLKYKLAPLLLFLHSGSPSCTRV